MVIKYKSHIQCEILHIHSDIFLIFRDIIFVLLSQSRNIDTTATTRFWLHNREQYRPNIIDHDTLKCVVSN